MFLLKKKLNPLSSHQNESDLDLKERLFFHDIINQTHGLLLFLNQKEVSGAGISKTEVSLIEKEIKTLQSLIRDHYNFKHKNLVQTFEWVPFSYAQVALSNLIQNYLSDVDVKIRMEMSSAHSEEDFIYYPAFYRIVNNLVKNIAESKCAKVDFHVALDTKGLFIETKNQMKKGVESSESLAQVILNEKVTTIKSMGLDSIYHLATEHNGSFSFEIIDNSWINKLFLPTVKYQSLVKSDKISA